MSDGVYAKAADIFRRRGGARGMLCTPEGLVCMVGAVGAARGATDDQLRGWDTENNEFFDNEQFYHTPEAEALVPLAEEMFGRSSLWMVNDRDGREAAQALLDEAAVRFS